MERQMVGNRLLGTIDLKALIMAQLDSAGVPIDQIAQDSYDTAVDRDDNGQFLFHSNRRDPTKRNLVVVHLL